MNKCSTELATVKEKMLPVFKRLEPYMGQIWTHSSVSVVFFICESIEERGRKLFRAALDLSFSYLCIHSWGSGNCCLDCSVRTEGCRNRRTRRGSSEYETKAGWNQQLTAATIGKVKVVYVLLRRSTAWKAIILWLNLLIYINPPSLTQQPPPASLLPALARPSVAGPCPFDPAAQWRICGAQGGVGATGPWIRATHARWQGESSMDLFPAIVLQPGGQIRLVQVELLHSLPLSLSLSV